MRKWPFILVRFMRFFHSIWVISFSAAVTAWCCAVAVAKKYSGKMDRAWSDRHIQNWVHRLLKISKVDVQIYNPHNTRPIAGKPTIIMCNHSSAYDIPISYLAFPECSMRMLAKKELSRIPLMGSAMRAADFPFIDRFNRQNAMATLAETKKLMEDGIIIWLAPEGTRSRTGKLGPFKKGGFITAIQAGATIIPIAIRGAFDILPKGSLYFSSQPKAEIHIGETIDASQYKLDDKDLLMEHVHNIMQHLLEG